MRPAANKISFAVVVLSLPLLVASCGVLKPKEEPNPVDFQQIQQNPLSPEETQEMLGEVGNNFIYGQGVGETAINVGTIAAFPPFAVVVVGNAALSLSGYEPLSVADALPEEEGSWWSDAFDSIASGPGRLAAAIAGEEYRSKEVAKEKLAPFIKRTPPAGDDLK